jgi:galactose mutarotase-like enzyme
MIEHSVDVTTRPGALPTWTLRAGEALAEVVPARGGLVSRFRVGSVEVLATDDEAVHGGTRNVRGGIPILFPAAGRLKDDHYLAAGAVRELKQHGFARDLPWRVTDQDTGGAVRLGMELVATAATLREFPWDFRLAFTVEVSGRSLRILQAYENRSSSPMPLHAGFHPYFAVPDAEKGAARIQAPEGNAWDKVSGRVVPLQGFDLTAPEVSLGLLDGDRGFPAATLARLSAPSLTAVEVEVSPELSHWVVWTLGGRDFLCVEPWTAPADALNTGKGLLWLAPEGRREMRLEIRIP